MFFDISQIIKNYQRSCSTCKLPVVSNNKFSNQNWIKNPEVILIWSRFQHYKLMKSQIINYKKQSSFIYITYIIVCLIFAPRKENRMSYINIPKISIIYLRIFISFVLFPHNSQILLSKKKQMQITFAKSSNDQTTQSSQCRKQKFWLVKNFIKFCPNFSLWM